MVLAKKYPVLRRFLAFCYIQSGEFVPVLEWDEQAGNYLLNKGMFEGEPDWEGVCILKKKVDLYLTLVCL